MSKTPVLHPVAEIHWRSVMKKFGFVDPHSVEQQWKSSCINYTNVLLDPETLTVRLLEAATSDAVAIELRGIKHVENLLDSGFRVESRPLWRRGNLCVLKLAKRRSSYPKNNARFAIVCVDTEKKTVIGTLNMGSGHGKDILRDVEIWDGSVSPDNKVLALSVGLVKQSHSIFEAFEALVIVYDIENQKELKRYTNLDNVMCAIDFDPRECGPASGNNYVMAGFCADGSTSRCISIYGLNSDVPLLKKSVENLFDSEAENAFYITYSRDGNYLIFQVLEGLGYSDEWLYNSYIFESDTLTLVHKCRPALASGCHHSCTPLTKPIQSRCGDYLALPNSSNSTKKADYNINIYRIPNQTNLMHQCRSVLLRNLKTTKHVNQLPLPQKLINYLAAALPLGERL